MADGSIARRYAKALVLLGTEHDSMDQIGKDLASFVGLLGIAGLGDALSNPGLTQGERRGVLDAVLAKAKLSAHAGSFLRLLIDKGRFGLLPQIQSEYQAMADARAGRVRATVTTASKLGKGLAGDVTKALESATGKTVLVDFAVDASLIGGMVAKVGDTVYDASVSTRLETVQQALIDNPSGPVAEAK